MRGFLAMRIHVPLTLCILASCILCYGQDTSPGSAGKTVTELGNSIFIVFQAKNGDYWFGTDVDGAYRYDGKSLTHFGVKDGLTGLRMREIQEDKPGNIYFSTQESGVFRFDGKKIEKLAAVKGEWKLAPDDLWFKGESMTNGPYRYDGKTLYSLEFPKHYLADEYFANKQKRNWSPYEVYKVYKDQRGHVWLGTSNFGVCRFDGKSLRWMYEQQQNAVEGGGWFGLRSILEDKDGAFWICNTKYRYRIEPGDPAAPTEEEKAKSLLRYKREDGIPNLKSVEGKDMVFFMSILEDKKGDLWMATPGEGVYRFDGKKVTHYPTMAGDKVITLFAIYQDNQGDLWLGTHKHGALKFNGERFERFRLK
jgi:ligand-binding sensor domain-containing protein